MPASQPLLDAQSAEAQRIEEDAVYSAKGHFNAADAWARVNLCLGVPATALSAGGAIAVKTYPSAAGVAAVMASILTGLMTFLKPSDRASKHKEAGGQYLTLRNQARIFRNVDLTHADAEMAAVRRLKELAAQRDRLNQANPGVPGWAYRKARKGIEAGESRHQVDQREET